MPYLQGTGFFETNTALLNDTGEGERGAQLGTFEQALCHPSYSKTWALL